MKKRRLHASWSDLPPKLILKVADMCDPLTVHNPQKFIDAGVPKELVEAVVSMQESDFTSQRTTLWSQDSEGNVGPVMELTGVFGGELPVILCDALGIPYKRHEIYDLINVKHQQRECKRAIREWASPQSLIQDQLTGLGKTIDPEDT